MEIQVKILDKELYKTNVIHSNVETINVPQYATRGSAAVDLRLNKDIIILPNSTITVGTGIAYYIRNHNTCAIVIPRSGIASIKGLILSNSIGLLDSDYQGEVLLHLWNRSEEVREFRRGERVAQLLFLPIIIPTFTLVDNFSDISGRGINSTGSTGVE